MPTLGQILAALLTALAFFAAMAGQHAQAEPIGWRFMSGDLEATSSTCIGSDESPVCAAETIIACTVTLRVDRFMARDHSHYPEVCEAADSLGMDTLPLFATGGPAPSRRGLYLYLLDVWSLGEDTSEAFRPGTAGDLVVDIYTGTCAEETDHPQGCAGLPFQDQERVDLCQEPDPNGFLVPHGSLVFRESPGGWRLTDFRSTSMDAGYRFCFRSRPERWRQDASELLR